MLCSPLVGDDYSQKNGGVEDDIINRVEKLWEEEDIELPMRGVRPLEFCNLYRTSILTCWLGGLIFAWCVGVCS